MWFTAVIAITGAAAAGCIGVMPLWILGIPGVENEYARGWKQGLSVLLTYPFAYLIGCAPYFFVRNHIGDHSRTHWQLATAGIALILFVIACLRLRRAFRTMK